MKLFKNFKPNIIEQKGMNINSAVRSFISGKPFILQSSKEYKFHGYTLGINSDTAFLYSIENYKRGKNKNDKKVKITYYLISIKVFEVLNLCVEQKHRYFVIKPYKEWKKKN